MSVVEKAQIMELVRKSPLSTKQTLEQLGIARSTYYAWRRRLERQRQAGLRAPKPPPRRPWNRLREAEKHIVLEYAHRYTDLSPRELAWRITDEGMFSVSESTV